MQLFNGKNRNDLINGKSRKLSREGALIAAIDIGTAKTVCFIARILPMSDGSVDCDIIGAGHYGAIARQHNDLNVNHDNYVNDQNLKGASSFLDREKAIRHAIDAAESMAGERIHEVHVSISGAQLQCRHVGVDLDVAGGVVTADDVAESLYEGGRIITPEAARCLHIIPTSYRLDGEEVGTDPRGLYGQELTTRMLGVHVRENYLTNIKGLVEGAGLKVASFVAAPLMMAQSTLVEDEKELGVFALDIGSRCVDYTIYNEGRPQGCGGIKLGSNHITRDIAQGFSTPIVHAERQKILHGTVFYSAADEHRLVDMIPLTKEDKQLRITRADLTRVIVPRLEEIYERLSAQIVADQCALKNCRRIVITGGGAQLNGIVEHAERIFGMKAKERRKL